MPAYDVDLSFARAQSLIGGATGSLPYQTANSSTVFAPIGANGTILQSNGTTATWVAASGVSAGSSNQVNTIAVNTSAVYFPTFVDTNNASATSEAFYTTSTFSINPATGVVGIGASDSGSPLTVKVLSTLSGTINSFQKVFTTQASGGTSNNVYVSEWRRRRATGTDWTTQNIHNGIWVDGSFTTPGTDTRTWWDRDPNTTSQAWGDQATTWMFVNSTGLGVGTTSPQTKFVVSNAGANGLEVNPTGGISSGALIQSYNRSGATYTQLSNYALGHTWQVGAAGSTRAVDIDSTGNVLIGTTSVYGGGAQEGKLTIVGGAPTADVTRGNIVLMDTQAYTAPPLFTIMMGGQYNNVSATTAFSGIGGGKENTTNGDSAGFLAFYTRVNSGARTERVRISSGGDLILNGTASGGGNNLILRGGTGTTSEGAQIVLGYGNNTSSAVTGQANNTWNIDVATGLANNNFRIFRQNSAGATVVAFESTESSGGVKLISLGVGTDSSGTSGEIRATNEITAYYSSDARLKENVQVITDPIEIVNQIRGVRFDWTDEHIQKRGGEDGFFVRKHDIGVIAQEIEAVLPELVATREDGFKAVKYEKIVPLLIEVVKAQQLQINQIREELNKLASK